MDLPPLTFYSFSHSFMYYFVAFFTHSFIHSFIHLTNYLFIHPCSDLSTYLLILFNSILTCYLIYQLLFQVKHLLMQVHRLSVVVQLLLGEIPDIKIFRESILKKTLAPYFQLTQGLSHYMQTLQSFLSRVYTQLNLTSSFLCTQHKS